MLSFLSEKGYIADTTEYLIALHDSTGKIKYLSKDYPISLAVNKEKSTAVEGVDFKLAGTDSPVYRSRNSVSSIQGDSPQDKP